MDVSTIAQVGKTGGPEDGPSPVIESATPQVQAPQGHEKSSSVLEDSENGEEGSASERGMGQALARLMQCLVEDWNVVEEESITAPGRKGTKRVFALLRKRTSNQRPETTAGFGGAATASVGDRYDYEQKYAADPYNEAMSPNARVWRVFLDEAGPFDLDLVENIRDTVDIILVFAGLFSGIVSTLLSQASTALQPNYGHITSALLTELVNVQRAIAAGGDPNDVIRSTTNLSSPYTTTSPDRWVNGLWFVSLASSLSTALLAVLVKQWIQAFVSPISVSGTPQHQGRIRHFRYMGIERWHVPLIAGLLPIFLHVSLFLFFAGLVVLLFTLDTVVAAFVLSIAVLAYVAHIIANLLPIWYPDCPYKTPLSTWAFVIVRILSSVAQKRRRRLQKYFHPAFQALKAVWSTAIIITQKLRSSIQWSVAAFMTACATLRGCWYWSRQQLSSFLPQLRTQASDEGELGGPERNAPQSDAHGDPTTEGVDESGGTAPKTLIKFEAAAVLRIGHDIDAHMLSWLCKVSANPSVRTVISAAVLDLRLGYPVTAMDVFRAGTLKHICAGLKDCTIPIAGMQTRALRPGFEDRFSKFMCAHLRLLSPRNSTLDNRGPATWCKCDWLLEQHAFGGIHEVFNMLHHPIYLPAPKPTGVGIHDLQRLQPSMLPQSAWILLLIQAVNDTLPMWLPTSPAWYSAYMDSWPAFTTLWILNSCETTIDRGNVKLLNPPTDTFTLLQGILLSAYLCRWSSQAGSIRLPEGNQNQESDLLARALRDEREQDLAQALISSHEEIQRQYQSLRLYYDLRATIHILAHLARTAPLSGVASMLYIVERLFPLRNYLFAISQEPHNRYYTTGGSKIFELPEDHPFMGPALLDQLIPSPVSIACLITRAAAATPSPVECLDVVLCLFKFLIQLNPERVFTILKQNDLLQALETACSHLLAVPKEQKKQRRAAIELADDVLNAYLEWASRRPDHADHLDYVSEYLTLVCVCSVVSHKEGYFQLPPAAFRAELIEHRPSDDAWENAIANLQQMPEVEAYIAASGQTLQRRNLDPVGGFIPKLRNKLHEAQLKNASRQVSFSLQEEPHRMFLRRHTGWL